MYQDVKMKKQTRDRIFNIYISPIVSIIQAPVGVIFLAKSHA